MMRMRFLSSNVFSSAAFVGKMNCSFENVCIGGVYRYVINALMRGDQQKYIYCLHYMNFNDRTDRYLLQGESFYVPLAKGKQFTE